MTESSQNQAELERTFRLMDVADELRRQHRRVLDHLEASDRQKIKDSLLARYQAMGHAADPALLDEAIDTVLRQQYRFREPAPGLSRRLASLYVRRGRIGRRVGLPLLAAILVGGGIFYGARLARQMATASDERAVERTVEQLHRRAVDLRERADRLAAQPDADAETGRIAREANAELTRAEVVLERYAPGGDPRAAVTRDNQNQVEAEAEDARKALNAAGAMLAQAETHAAEGRESERLLAEANQYLEGIEAVAVESSVRERARTLRADAVRYAGAGRLNELRDATRELADLEHVLEQAYRLVVVKGRERDETRYYLIVQAVDARGRPVRVRIRNQETGRFEEVSEWGERVPKSLYDRVAADFRADNVIDDDSFGEKKRGYLHVERRYEDLGQITDY